MHLYDHTFNYNLMIKVFFSKKLPITKKKTMKQKN